MKPNAPLSALRVVDAITRHADATGQDPHCITVSHRNLAKLAGYADPTGARHAVAQAVNHGYLVRLAPSTHRTPSVYSLVLEDETAEEARQAGLALLATVQPPAAPSVRPKAQGLNPYLLRAVLEAAGLSDREKVAAIGKLVAA